MVKGDFTVIYTRERFLIDALKAAGLELDDDMTETISSNPKLAQKIARFMNEEVLLADLTTTDKKIDVPLDGIGVEEPLD